MPSEVNIYCDESCHLENDGIPIMDEKLLLEAMEKARNLDLPVSLHEEDPLFIAQPDRRPATDPVPGERASNEASAMPIVRDVSAIVPQSGGLFIARAGEGTVR